MSIIIGSDSVPFCNFYNYTIFGVVFQSQILTMDSETIALVLDFSKPDDDKGQIKAV
ncbi:hypothetical protein [Ruminococcus flavefaciens]|uniref:hypothetical protein n=1 Tax=Ruminococcus flavefaciens TaxID=1265 RepID=UPI0015872EDA|nr:hypothetical protein [Ruminococcus flavefaciens]